MLVIFISPYLTELSLFYLKEVIDLWCQSIIFHTDTILYSIEIGYHSIHSNLLVIVTELTT